jgi:prepilin-type N-terminal cleavage/methylation domain-containing protein
MQTNSPKIAAGTLLVDSCTRPIRQFGFSLTELAIVLVIVALLLGGLLVPLSAQYDNANTSAVQKSLSDIQEALIGFAITNGRLPCPALATTIGVGSEQPPSASGCANKAGVLPWATLGVNETDPWGHRYSYRVTKEFTPPSWPGTSVSCATTLPNPAPANASFALCSQGDLTVFDTSGGNSISINVPAIVISHGKNGHGAYTTQGTLLGLGSDTDEQDNQLTGVSGTSTANAYFVSKLPTDSFDDVVVWISPNILFNRMVAAGKLP